MSSGIKRLFYDIETSPNLGTFWRAGYKQTINPENIIKERAIICLCYKWEGADPVYSVEWKKGNDKNVCIAFGKLLDDADEIVGHNANRFDLPWLCTRNAYHNLKPYRLATAVDTLHMARKRFYFNSNRLDYIAKFLGFSGKHETDYSMWQDIMFNHCPTAMAKMVHYCQQDVLILEKVYHKLREYNQMSTHTGAHIGNGRWSCPQCGSQHVRKNKSRTTPMGMERHEMHCKDCNRHYSIANPAFKGYQEHKLSSKG